ncbi:MAG: adenylate cyclase, partial [Actinomycetota bacterium]|nr:adenylate cyclase [Actinomycetota bacterium]
MKSMNSSLPDAADESTNESSRITVFLADDNVIVREGVRALLNIEPDLEVVGTAGDYDELIAGAEAAAPQVLVTDIRMPPAFQREGIDAAKELRKRHPGTGVVILSQYDDPEYAISLLADGAAGYAYLLKDSIAEGNQLARAVREVATGGSVLDPKIVEALVHPVAGIGGLTADEERLLQQVAEGRPIKAIAAAQHTTPAAIAEAVEQLFITLSKEASTGEGGSL